LVEIEFNGFVWPKVMKLPGELDLFQDVFAVGYWLKLNSTVNDKLKAC